VSLVVVMGSGETAPTMVKIHRQVFAETAGHRQGPAVMLDTPFGFQMNADDLVARTRQYFAESVGTSVEVARWRRADEPLNDRERSLALLNRASWAFAGPGSPTYALRQWRGTGVPQALLDVAAHGGTLVFGSAAACTLGTHAIPVYEIYKVGEEPRWEPGLDLLGGLTGLHAVVVPHFDNAEGGGHDTRYCYLGEQRLATLETELPDEIGVIGVDEHTALLIDVEARTARVAGNGVVTVRRHGRSLTFPSGTELTLDRLDALLRGTAGDEPLPATPGSGDATALGAPDRATPEPGPATPDSLGLQARLANERFDAALAARDVDGCVAAVLDLEAAIVAWSTDTLQSADADRARRTLRALVVRLGELARDGARDPAETVAPFVNALLELRGRARAARDYAASDLVRDRLTAAGVDVRDTPDGVQWSLHSSS
jgi:cyanophycinase-like exopeptidase